MRSLKTLAFKNLSLVLSNTTLYKNLIFFRKELMSITLPEEWYKGIMEFSAEDSTEGSLMIAWIGGTAAEVVDKLPEQQVKIPFFYIRQKCSVFYILVKLPHNYIFTHHKCKSLEPTVYKKTIHLISKK